MGQSSSKTRKSKQHASFTNHTERITQISTQTEHIEPPIASNTANEIKDIEEHYANNSKYSNAVNTELETSPLTHLPMDLILEIFSRLEVYEIVSFQIVSPSWCDLLRSQRLWRVKCQQYWPNYPLHAISDYFKFFLKRGGVYFIRSAEHLNRIATDENEKYDFLTSISNSHKLPNGLVLMFEKSERRYRKTASKEFWSKTALTFKDGCNLVLAPKFLEDEDHDYILLETSFSHDLISVFEQRNFANPTVYCEKKIIKIMLQIMNALKTLHDLNIAADRWNDFSFVVDMCGDWFEVKLERYKDRYSSPPSTGMPYISFTAPDVMTGTTDTLESNMWSLVGTPTFYADARWINEYHAIMKGEYTWPENYNPISDKAKDFVNRLIVVDPTKRMTLKEAFAHPWLNDPNPSTVWLEQSEKAFLGPSANRPQLDDIAKEEPVLFENFNYSPNI